MINGRKTIVTVPSSTSKLHIEQKSKTELRIYVPSEEKQRLLCYCKLLPERLISNFFMTKSDSDHSETDTNAARVVAAVLNAPQDKQILKDLLTQFGIRGLPEWFEKNSAGSSDESDDDGCSQTSIDTFAASVSSSRSSVESAGSDHSGRFGPADSTSTFAHSSPSRSAGTIPRPLPHQVSRPVVHGDSDSEAGLESQEEYVKLLGRIRDAAREADIPTQRPIDVSSSTNATENDPRSDSPYPTTAFGSRSVNQLKHDMKLGAAGELYVRIVQAASP